MTSPVPSNTQADLLPVSSAKNGFTPQQWTGLIGRYSYDEAMTARDLALFTMLNNGATLFTTRVSRVGDVQMLAEAPNPAIGQVRYSGVHGDLSLDEFLAHPHTRAQAMIVVHEGRIIFETYPGMRPYDNRAWMSCAKSIVGFIIWDLIRDGKVEAEAPVETYLTDWATTEWRGTRVIDIADMCSGMDVIETPENRLNPHHVANRYNQAAVGAPNADGVVEVQQEVMRMAKRLRSPGEAFEYASVNTSTLGMIAQAVENKVWADIVFDRIWKDMTAEGDLEYSLTPQGFAQMQGMAIGRLRDLARWGMLHTPSWGRAARRRIVPEAYVREVQTGGRPEIYLGGEIGNRMSGLFAGDRPVANHFQWDAVFADGNIYKGGVFGQGLYVAPDRDLVIAWHSTALTTELTHYARLIAKEFGSG